LLRHRRRRRRVPGPGRAPPQRRRAQPPAAGTRRRAADRRSTELSPLNVLAVPTARPRDPAASTPPLWYKLRLIIIPGYRGHRGHVMRKLLVALVLLAAATAVPAQDQVLNLYSSRHYRTDEALYRNFTEATGIRINRLEAGEDALI